MGRGAPRPEPVPVFAVAASAPHPPRLPARPAKGDSMSQHQLEDPAVESPRANALANALEEVGVRLDAPGLSFAERKVLLQRQAELGDLRDEVALRARRVAGER